MDKTDSEVETSDEESSSPEESTYTIRPPFQEKFSPVIVKDIIKTVLIDELGHRKYFSFDPHQMSQHLSDIITEKLQVLPYPRYKYIIHTVIAEQKGQGMRLSSISNWDADTDNTASDFIITEYLICVVTVFASYYY